MSRFGTFMIGSLVGLILGGVLVFYFFVGVPRSNQSPGSPIQPPDVAQPATAQIVLKQEFFNEALTAIFRDMNPPTFPLTTGTEQCPGSLTLLPESGGIKTSVSFENNKIVAPLAFRGSYNSMLGCLNFSGWAQSNMELRYDGDMQTVYGQFNVETVNLEGVNPILSGIITPLVQSTLNQRVNPIQILQGKQLAFSLPIKASDANLMANLKEIRSEIKDNAVYLYVIYELNGKAEKSP